VAQGEMHKRQRKVLTPAFAPSCIRDTIPICSAKADVLVNVFLEQLKSQTPEGIEVGRTLSRAALDIIGSAGFHLF
jgi:cytochrome P450